MVFAFARILRAASAAAAPDVGVERLLETLRW
jgi:hypothetical protein